MVALILLQNQIPDISQEILTMYEAMRPQWFAAVWPATRSLFFFLALIDFAIAGGRLMLERHSMEEWIAALLQKVMGILGFFALLIFGVDWMTSIIDSFRMLGQRGSGVSGISPGEVFLQGLNIGGAIVSNASAWAYMTDIGGALTAVLASFIVVISFTLIATSYMVLLVESFICLTAGLIFLGFGGSKWTQPYVERYIALAFGIGIKIMLLYFLIGVGMVLSNQWLATAKALNTSAIPGTSTMAVMCSALMFLLLCWQIPKVFSSMLAGAPSLTGGDAVGMAMMPAAIAYSSYYAASRMAAAAGAGNRPVGTGPGSSGSNGSGGSIGINGNGGRPGGGGGNGSSGGGFGATLPRSVPASPGKNGSGKGFGGALTAAKYTATRTIPHEGGGSAPPPPKLPIEDKD